MNPVVHFELPYKDAQRAARFYSKVFGWKTQNLGPDMGDYVLCTTAESDTNGPGYRGTINGGLYPLHPDWPAQHPSVVIAVEDVNDAMQRITKAGGEVLGEPMLIPGVGHYVSFFDTEGNRNSVLQPMVG